MSEKLLNRIYDILVQVCGAAEDYRDGFVMLHQRENFPTEWRFIGTLGFGGKFWRKRDAFSVTCYSEDETRARLKTMKEANQQLKQVYADSQMEKDPSSGTH